MKHFLYPDEYVKSAYQIDYETLYGRGIRGLIFDIDNTLVPHGAPADSRAIALFARLKKLGFSCVLLSNNKEPRVRAFNDKVGVRYIFKANKPAPASYRRAMELMRTDESSTVLIGDQIFTDVAGARLTGIYSILVEPMDPREELQIVLKRYPEKAVLFFYRRRQKRLKEKSGACESKSGRCKRRRR